MPTRARSVRHLCGRPPDLWIAVLKRLPATYGSGWFNLVKNDPITVAGPCWNL